jgi:hypothetical protein
VPSLPSQQLSRAAVRGTPRLASCCCRSLHTVEKFSPQAADVVGARRFVAEKAKEPSGALLETHTHAPLAVHYNVRTASIVRPPPCL